MFFMLNCSLRLRRIIHYTRRSGKMNNAGLILRIAIKVAHIGMDAMTVVSVLSAAAVLVLHSDFLGCIVLIHPPATRK